jgi:hypothetical protein
MVHFRIVDPRQLESDLEQINFPLLFRVGRGHQFTRHIFEMETCLQFPHFFGEFLFINNNAAPYKETGMEWREQGHKRDQNE